MLEQREGHDVFELQVLVFHVEDLLANVADLLPMSFLHGLVLHRGQEWTALGKVIDVFAQVFVSLPSLELLWQTLAPGTMKE